MYSIRSPSKESKPQRDAPSKDLIDLKPPSDPPVTYIEMLRFWLWVAGVVLTQAFRDLKMGRIYHPNLSTDLATHYFVSSVALANALSASYSQIL